MSGKSATFSNQTFSWVPDSTQVGTYSVTFVADNGQALFAAIRDRVPAQYATIKGKHYDVYRGEGYAKALMLQKAWLGEHLPL